MRVYLGLGGNIGEVKQTLAAAVNAVEALGTVSSVSSLYRSAAREVTEQPDYLNAVLVLDTSLEPKPLLGALKAIEALLGRHPDGVRYGPRAIDLDMLVIEGRTVALPELTVPHPRLHERRFVLEPLSEIAPTLHPWAGSDDMRADVSVSDLLELVDDQKVRKVENSSWCTLIGPA